MVRNNLKNSRISAHLKENLYEAVQAVRNGELSSNTASQLYKIPRQTIVDHVMNSFQSKTLGRDVVFSTEIEDLLVTHLRNIELHGFGLSKKEFLKLVGNYIVKNNIPTPFKNGIPGDEWFLGFRKRHNLAIKVEQRKKLVPVCQSLLEPVASDSAHEEADSDDSVVDANEEDTALCAFSWEKPHDAIPCTDEPNRNISSSAERGDDEFKTESHDDKLHVDFKCNECGAEIVGYRYTCVQCCDVDLCSACEASGAHPEHYVLRLPRPEPAGAVKGVLETLRGLLDQEPLIHLPQGRIKMEVDDDPLHKPTYDEPDGLEEEEENFDVKTLWIDSRETHADTTIENTSPVPHQTHATTEAAPDLQVSSPAKKFSVPYIRARKPKHVKPLLVDSGVVTRAGIRVVRVSEAYVGATGGDVGASENDVRASGAGVRVVGAGVTVPVAGVRVAEADVGPSGVQVRASRGHVRVSGAGIKVSGAGITVSRAGVREPGPAPKRTAVVKLTEMGAIELGETKISLKPRNRPSYRDK